jgi:hypothetical protein
MFDLHLLEALFNGFEYYLTNEADFKSLFWGVRVETLNQWWTLFTQNKPVFRARYAQGTAQAPMITVVGGQEDVQEKLIGKVEYRDTDGRLVVGYNIMENAQAVIFAKSPELARIYFVVLRASIEQSTRALLKAGYSQMSYEGTTALDPEEELSSEEMGIYVRKMNFVAHHPVQIKLSHDSEFGTTKTYSTIEDILVLSSDLKKNGIVGGVVPDQS